MTSFSNWLGRGALLALGACALVGCADAEAETEEGADAITAKGVDGTIAFATYNVGGLADFISSGTPSEMMPLISPKLNAYGLVLMQEDFAHHKALVAQVTHPYRIERGRAGFLEIYGDGLSGLSRYKVRALDHREWKSCNGTFDDKNDCLASKGFRCAVVELEPGVPVDVCNLHMDAGRGEDDGKTRAKQAAQFVTYVNEHFYDHPVIVAGDTNLKTNPAQDEQTLVDLMARTGLRDACRELGCAQPALHDRVFVRDASRLKLTVAKWRLDGTFKTPGGQPLSDHEPVAVDISWTKR